MNAIRYFPDYVEPAGYVTSTVARWPLNDSIVPDNSYDDSGVHRQLAHFNAQRLRPCGPQVFSPDQEQDHHRCLGLQQKFIDDERSQVRVEAAAAPTHSAAFLDWFLGLREHGAGQHDGLFPWLAGTAGLREMRWFLTQEAAGEAGFDDLVALTQVKLPTRPKLEMARNFWDEMGRGQESGMHGEMLNRLVGHLDLQVSIDHTVEPSLALGNLMVALATQRQYTYHSIGALGIIELTAPGRVAQVAAGLHRLGISPSQRLYFDLHAVLDVKHSLAWNQEVIGPLVEQDPQRAAWIAEGALMRLNAGARCFSCYRCMLRVGHGHRISNIDVSPLSGNNSRGQAPNVHTP